MKIKQIPEDFKVDEIYDLETYTKKTPESKDSKFFYFKLWKRDYTTQRAIEQVCRVFKLGVRDAHFSGTKDRQAVTTQLISTRHLRKNWEEDLKYFNEKNPDIKLEFVGIFPARLNLGDNSGNKFTIVVRDLEKKDIQMLNMNLPKIKKFGVPNFFDSQRFGFQNKNIVIGKYLLRGEFDKAFFHIITTIPEDNKKPEHQKFIDYLTQNYSEIIKTNNWDEALKLIPSWLNMEIEMIQYVKKYKNDFLGAISLIHKKIRTIYIAAYQSYIFNELLKYLDDIGELQNYKELPLIASESKLKEDWATFVKELLSKDGLNLNYFEMKRTPTLKPKEIFRQVFVEVENLQIGNLEDDDLNVEKKKITISFDLQSGSYATNVIKYLFQDN